MPQFNIINDIKDIQLNDSWVAASKFNSKDRIVDADGRQVSASFIGPGFRLIEKRERNFSLFERIRQILFAGATAITSGSAFQFRTIKTIFTNKSEKIRFAVAVVINPKLLVGEVEIEDNRELNFAVINKRGKETLMPVIGKQFGNEYQAYPGSAMEALLRLAQYKEQRWFWDSRLHYGSPIGFLLKHPANTSLHQEEFLKFLLEKDANGTQRICTLNAESLEEVIEMLKEQKIAINLHEKSHDNQTLFTLWAGTNNIKITRLLLEQDPTIITQLQGQKRSAFIDSILHGNSEEAELLKQAMETAKIPFTKEEEWVKRAHDGELFSTDEEFQILDQDLKTKIYYVANAFHHIELVERLKTLGCAQEPLYWPGPTIFAQNMDIVTTKKKMLDYLKTLRKEGLLLTSEEFSKLDKNKYIEKSDQIGRLAGKSFIERIARDNELTAIKVPRKIVVLKEGVSSLSFNLSPGLEMVPTEDQLTVYAERIRPVKRKLSLEEGLQFMIALEKTGYGDFWGRNFFITEDGIYYIDTEFKDFSPREPSFGSINLIIDKLESPEDKEKFQAAFDKRKASFEQKASQREEERTRYSDLFKDPYKRLTDGFGLLEFPLGNILADA